MYIIKNALTSKSSTEGGRKYVGARYYDPKTSLWLSTDPLASQAPGWTPYRYGFNNPIRFIDPDGRFESTHIDEDGNVVAVYNDGDNGVYQHSNESLKNFDSGLMSLSTSNTTRVGETANWNEFVSPETGNTLTNYQLQVGKSFDPIIQNMHKEASGMDLVEIAQASKPNQKFDLKKDYSNVGALLNGKYATSRSAGNFLAGYNAEGGTYMGVGIDFETFQKLAGALHIESSNNSSLSKLQMLDIVHYGTYISSMSKGESAPSGFVAPTWGENNYQYRMSKAGWEHGENN